MKVFVFVAAVVAVASAVNPAALYRSRCSEGASYWCESAQHADECGAVEYCIQNRWKGHSVQASSVCSNCEACVNGVRNVLDQTSVQNLIVEGATEACAVMESLSAICKTVVETLGPEVLQKLVSELTTDEVCHVLGFCKEQTLNQESPELCGLCKLAMTELHQVLSDTSTQQSIENEVLSLCPLLESFLPNCKELVQEFFPMAIELLLQYANAQTCTDLGVCPGNAQIQHLFGNLRKLAREKNTFDLCSSCKLVTGNIDNFLSNPAVQEGFRLELDQLCYTLGTAVAPICTYFVNTYTKQIFAAVVALLNPDTFCSEIGLCPSSMQLASRPQLPADQCSDCEAFFQDITSLLTNQTVQNLLIHDLEEVCDQLGSFADQCKSYVDSYASVAFSFMASYINPQQICQSLSFCGARHPTLQLPADQCSDCEAFFQDITGLLTNQTVQNLLIHELEEVCDKLGSFADQCKTYVDSYASVAFSFVASFINPQQVCQTLTFCSARQPALKRVGADPKLCADCKAFVTDVDNLLKNQTFEQQTLEQLEQLCSLAGSLEAECKLLIQTYGPQIFQFLLTYLQPEAVCTQLHFCSADSAPVAMAPLLSAPMTQPLLTLQAARPLPQVAKTRPQSAKPLPLTDGPECAFCQMIVGYFEMANGTEEEILNAVAEMCKLLPTEAATECDNYVHDYGYLILELLREEFSPKEVCETLGMCSSQSKLTSKQHKVVIEGWKRVVSRLPYHDTQFCALCQLAVQEIDAILSSNKSKEEIVAEFEKLICSNLPSPVDQQCDSFMSIYGDALVQLLIEQFDPKTFCSDVGLCDATTTPPKFIAPQPEATIECIVCEYLVQELENLLEENATEAEIRQALDVVCSYLPASLSAECEALVSEYSEAIIKYLVNEFDPSALCTAIGVCTAETTKAVALKAQTSTQDCILCEYIMSEIEKLLSENDTQAEIEAALDKVCSLLPSTIRTECAQFVNTYTPLLISYLTQDLPPKAFCTTARFCSAGKVEQPAASVECAICELVVSQLDSMLSSNATQEEIQKALDEVCDILPATVRSDCEAFVATYEPLLLKYLLDETPSQICTLFKLCPGSIKSYLDSLGCDMCQIAVREFMNAIQEPSVTKEIVTVVNDTCAILPPDLKAECYSYVDQYGDLVTEFIAQFFDPITSCTLIGECPAPSNNPVTPKKHLLGARECTRGPGFWCASMENAQQCNMVEHCRRHVWN